MSSSIGARLRKLRAESGLTQRQLAATIRETGPADSHISGAYISRLEKGERHPSVRAIRALAAALHADPHYLEVGEPDPRDERIAELESYVAALEEVSEARRERIIDLESQLEPVFTLDQALLSAARTVAAESRQHMNGHMSEGA